MVRFEGKIEEEFVELYWETSSEINNDYFVIEKSFDGVSFNEVGIVHGNGNSTVTNQYYFTDFSNKGTAFYRLKQIDFDGAFEYSSIIKVTSLNNPKELMVFPNPMTRGQLMTISFKEANEVRLFDSNGSIVYMKNIGMGNHVFFSTSSLAPGNYIAQVISGSDIQFSQFLVAP